ncbi:hypothetical protein A7985_11755 [Pseudoalteromonas luteoviolacea]|uniref:Uncharacterized protein n=1 Tax=Pseudoalteromonas luteoviolacea TaxID=43657 RepID=A0A1C0TR76_9GAMM|nr:hypothetical protein [Pseudoalteromonas luteoviolacea]OCQ21293.1 hypothetical protein A7985_11755 [Pseudoalteromonas luteoviolacea]
MLRNSYVVLVFGLLNLLLVGCKSNNVQVIQAPKLAIMAEGERLSPYQLNKRFLATIKQNGIMGASSFIDADATLRHYKEAYDSHAEVSGEVFTKGLLKGLKSLDTLGEFNYLGTDEKGEGFWQSFYRFETDEGAFYFHLVWRDGRYLTDVKFESLSESVLGFAAIANSQAKLEKPQQEIFAKIIASLMRKDFVQAQSQLNSLSDAAKENVLLQVSLWKLAQATPSNESHSFVDELAKIIKPEDRTNIGWLQYYKRKKAHRQALELLNDAPDILKRDPFYILEKSAIHLEVGDYSAVWRGIHDLFYLGGEDFINYVFAAQLAINMKEFEYAVEILSVAEEKYELNFLKQDLVELDDGVEFVNSSAFKKWRGNS